MGRGRQFAAYNINAPGCVEALSATTPACFTRIEWHDYLAAAYRAALDDRADRARMESGVIDYCADCTAGYRQRMREEGRCHPPNERDDS